MIYFWGFFRLPFLLALARAFSFLAALRAFSSLVLRWRGDQLGGGFAGVLADVGEDALVDVAGDAGVAVAEGVRHDLHVDAGGEHEHGCAVAEVVQPDRQETSQQRLEDGIRAAVPHATKCRTRTAKPAPTLRTTSCDIAQAVTDPDSSALAALLAALVWATIAAARWHVAKDQAHQTDAAHPHSHTHGTDELTPTDGGRRKSAMRWKAPQRIPDWLGGSPGPGNPPITQQPPRQGELAHPRLLSTARGHSRSGRWTTRFS